MTPTFGAPAMPNRLAVAIALSMALHIALLWAYRQPPAARPADSAPARPLSVRLRPPAPEPVPQPALEPPPEAARPAQAAPPKRRARVPAKVIAIDKTAPTPPDAFTVEPAPAVEAPPRFDREAASRIAREMANEPDPARAATAVGQFAPKPLATETKLARAIAGAKRRDCKDGLPGGLLGPLLILMDKKDSGCKW